MSKTDLGETSYTVSDFISWARDNTLILNPQFQRRPVWKTGAKSFLIDTILRGFPTPVIYLRDQKADLKTLQRRREVVDGQQRIRTLLAFVSPNLVPDFKPDEDTFEISRVHNKALSRKAFPALPTEAQQAILEYKFGVHVFGAATSDRDILQIFARLNATGVRLNDQELRNAEWYGEFKTAAYELALEQLDRWKAWNIFTSYNIARMDEVEFTSELIIFILNGVTEKSKSKLNAYYEKYDDSFPSRIEISRRFRHIMDMIETGFTATQRSLFNRRTLFYCVFGALYSETVGSVSPDNRASLSGIAASSKSAIIRALQRIEIGKAPKGVLDATTRRTTHVRERTAIIRYLTPTRSA